MRFVGIFFLLCISVGTVSSFSLGNIQWPSWLTSLFTNSVDQIRNQVCTYLAAHPECALNATNSIKTTLQKTNETTNTFVQTIEYLNTTQNQQNLVGGTTTCKTFFEGLQTAIKNDLTNKKIDASTAQATALQALKNMLDDLKKFLNDIDDTIKLTDVTSSTDTVSGDYKSISGMSDIYQYWQNKYRAIFGYLTASPDQLYPFLREFLGREKFPATSFHIRHLTWFDFIY